MMAWLLLQDTRDNAGRWKDRQHCLEGFIPTVPSQSVSLQGSVHPYQPLPYIPGHPGPGGAAELC